MQSSLGSRIKRVDKDDLIKGNLIFATVKSVNYQFQTAELEQSGAMNKVGSKGKFSVPIPREFIGRSPEGSLFGHSPLLAPGTKVLVGFVDGDRNSPVILSSYGKPSDNALLSPLPIKGGEFKNKGIYKYAGAIHKIFPSMTYEFIDGDGTQVKTYPGKTFLSIASKPDEKPSASDFYLGTSYADLYSSRYGDEKLIEPRSQVAPNILFKHQGTHTADGNEDTHITMLGIDEKGAMRASVLDKKSGFRTTQEIDEKGNYRVVHQPNELILGETEDKLEFGINTESQTFYIRQGTKLYEFTDNGMTVDGKLPEDIIAEVVNNSEIGIINLIDDSERERGGEENPLYTIDLAPVFDLHGVDKPYSLSFELKTLSTKDRDDIKVYMGDGSSTKYSFVNKTVKASKEFTRITLEGIKPILKDDSAKTAVLAFSGSFNNNNIPVVRMLKLEHGTKSSPWSPSNKDIESRVKVLGEEIVLDFADGIIDASELKRLKTHIEIMNRTYTDFEKRYEALISNPDFKDDSLKASLVTAKNDFNKKSQVLIDTLLKVISDGIIEAVENEDTQRAFKEYDNAVASLNTLIDDVIKTISVKMAGDLVADFEGVLGNVNSSIAKLQKQADGSIVTYYYSEDPTMFNKPTVEWDTDELKSMHVGDYYFNMATGEAFEFFHDEKGYRWITNDNQAIVKALEKASKAQDTADHKRRVFVTTPIPPYEIGDMWTQGTDGDIKVCKITRLVGKYDPADWGLASKYTDDSLASSALNVANTAQSNLDGFKKTVETVFRDGIIDEAESKQLQVHIDLMNRDKVELDNTYNKFMSDLEFTALPESSKLSLDKGQYDLAFKELFNIFNTAIQDKIIMPEETVNVSRAMSSYDNKLSGLKISLQNATQALVSVEASKQVKAFNGVIDDIINNYKELKIQADGVVNTYYYGYEPTVNNIPASNWTTTTEKNAHLGDYFMDTSTGKVYTYKEHNGNFTWEALTNQAVVDAITSAKDAQDTADNKRRIFTDTPYPPYDIGDMWVQGVKGDIFVARVSKSDNTEFLISDWVKASKYTDDTKANEAKAKADSAYNSALLGISQAQDAQQKATTAYNNFNTFETTTFKAYQDGVISDIEKAKLNSQLSIIEVDCNKVIASTDEYLNNQYLPSQFKTTLTTYKNGLATAFEKLKNIYTTIISDNKITKEELSQSSTVLSDYQTALLNLVKETEKSNLAISKALTDNSIATFNSNISAVVGNINDIKNQVDGSINTYFYGYEPALSNEPASAWNTVELKDTHVGDYFTDLSTGRVYKFTKSGSTYKWTPETNQAIVKAMSDAKNAQDTADGKRRVFAVQPTPPYDAGDMWTQGVDGDILVATVGRVKGTSFNQSDWTKASKYTDDAKAVEAQRVAGQALSSASAVSNNFSIFKDTTFTAYQDKVISDFEKSQMKTQLDAIESDNAVLLAQYADILASKYLEDKIKVSLTNKKDLYINAYNTLKSSINGAILDDKITATEIATTRTAITNYTSKLAEFQVVIQQALANISDNTALNNIVSAVDKIEIGGVNLIKNSAKIDFVKREGATNSRVNHLGKKDVVKIVNGQPVTYTNPPVKLTIGQLEKGKTYTLSFSVTAEGTIPSTLSAYLSNTAESYKLVKGKIEVGKFNRVYATYEAREDSVVRIHLNLSGFEVIYLTEFKLEEGNKPTGYNLAPEDYDNLIRDVRQETADVSDALGNFSSTVNTTFRDGIITETEAKKLTTAKKQLEREKAEMDSKYSALVALPSINTNTKNDLVAKKKVFDTAHKKSLDYMSSAIANKKISINEMNTLDSYLDEYRDTLSNLTTAFENAVDNNIQQKVDSIEIGGRNLILGTDFIVKHPQWISTQSPYSYSGGVGMKQSMPGDSYPRLYYQFKDEKLRKDGVYTLSFQGKSSNNKKLDIWLCDLNGANKVMNNTVIDYTTEWKNYTITFTASIDSIPDKTCLQFWSNPRNSDSENTLYIKEVKLEKGNKATGWSHAPEDIIKEFDTAKDSLSNFEKYVKESFKDGIISSAELVRLRTHKETLDRNKKNLDTRYKNIYNNSNLTDTAVKTALSSSYSTFVSKHNDLMSKFNSAISNGKITTQENKAVMTALNAYDTALANLTTNIEKAIVSQGDSQLTQLTKLATTTSNNFADFKDNTFRTYSDNTLDTFEKQQLKAKLAVVTTNYKDLSKRYEDIVNNNMLSPKVKSTLVSTKNDFTKSYDELISSINTFLKSTKLTPTITQPVDNAMDNYQTAMSVFTVELQKALNDIANNQAIAKAKEAVDSIVIGGNNILNNSDFSIGSKYWTTNGTASFETVDGYTVAKITNLSGAGIYQIIRKNIEDDYYILSFRAKAIGSSATIKVGMLNQGVGKISDFSIDNKWKTYSYSFTSPVNTSLNTYFHIYSTPQAQQGFYITQVQLEKGNKATDWALSLSDVEEKNNNKITNATSDWTKKLNDELSALKNPDSFPASAIKIEALLVDKLMSQAQLTEKLVANNAFVNSLMTNSIVTQKIQSTDIEAVRMRAVDKGSSISIEGGTLTFKKSDKSKIEMSIDSGINMYNSVGKKVFGLDKTFAMVSALGTTGGNVYLAANLGYEVRTVDITKIPSDGAPGSYEYVPIRTLGIRSRPGDILPIGSDYGVFITSNTLLEGGETSFRTLSAEGFKGNFLDINSLTSGVNLYIRPLKKGEVKITTTGTTGDYRPIRASAFTPGSYYQYKEDITKWDYDALSVIKSEFQAYQYKLINDENGKLRRGVIVGGNYETIPEFIDNDGVDLYEMTTWALRGIQQIAVKIEKLEENIYGTTKP